MAYHGLPLKYGYDPVKEDIYPLFTHYFDNPRMTKIKDIGEYSMFLTKIHALLGVEFRYLIVFVHKLEANTKFLSELKWVSLQTRTLKDDHNLPFHSYAPKRNSELDKKIELKKKDETQYTYSVDKLPIEIILLPKEKGPDYNRTGSVINALETYQTLVNFI
jgi:hypothetical protein